MILAARLKSGETLGDRIMKVDHAGEHGAICIYRAQIAMARWRAPEMVGELQGFLEHERRHRERFGAELIRHGARRCRSYAWCGLDPRGFWPRLLNPIVAVSTEAVIWLGMRL
jgi:3-demethoxyubiquinol 3-hydroxylase